MPRNKDRNTRLKMPPAPWPKCSCFLLVTLLIGIMGCASASRLPSASAERVALPDYHEGTTFVYSNGSLETVQEVTPDRVVWRNHRGYLSSGSPDFTYRRATWETRTRSGTRSFRGRKDWLGNPSAASLWPLAPGKTARYIESGRWQDAEGKVHTYDAQWRAEVVGPMRVRVKAGEFDVWKIVARRFSSGGVYEKSRLREVRTWYYAPAAGHYVKMERSYLGRRPRRTIELLAITPSVGRMNSEARTRVQTNFQQALEEKRSGVPLRWNLTEQALSGTTTPMATFRLNGGAYCRQYIQYLNQAGAERAFYGLACRSEKGQWGIPRQ